MNSDIEKEENVKKESGTKALIQQESPLSLRDTNKPDNQPPREREEPLSPKALNRKKELREDIITFLYLGGWDKAFEFETDNFEKVNPGTFKEEEDYKKARTHICSICDENENKLDYRQVDNILSNPYFRLTKSIERNARNIQEHFKIYYPKITSPTELLRAFNFHKQENIFRDLERKPIFETRNYLKHLEEKDAEEFVYVMDLIHNLAQFFYASNYDVYEFLSIHLKRFCEDSEVLDLFSFCEEKNIVIYGGPQKTWLSDDPDILICNFLLTKWPEEYMGKKFDAYSRSKPRDRFAYEAVKHLSESKKREK